MFHKKTALAAAVSLVFLLVLSAPASAKIDLRRIGHRQRFVVANNDAPVAILKHKSLSGLGDGRIVVSPELSSPALFELHPDEGVLEAIAVSQSDGGNEDDGRGTNLCATKTGSVRHFMWEVGSYHVNDVFLSRAEPVAGVTPVSKFNMDTGHGGVGDAIDFDNTNNIAFVGMSRAAGNSEVMTAFRLECDGANSTLTGRTLVTEPRTDDDIRLSMDMLRCDPEHNLVVASAGVYWTDRERIYLIEYTPQKSGDAIKVDSLTRLDKPIIPVGLSGGGNEMFHATSADFVVSGGRLYLIIGASYMGREWDFNPSYGLYVFDLGAEGGPYTLTRPKSRIPFHERVHWMKVYGDQVIVSCHGLYVLDLGSVLNATGLADITPDISYPLPYRTYEFAIETIDAKDYLVLGSGADGLDIFAFAGDAGAISGDILAADEEIALEGGSAKIALKTGGGIRHINAPALNDNDEMALWAVTDNEREAILIKKKGEPWRVGAVTGRNGYVSFSSPSMNNNGTVVCYVGKSDGAEGILRIDDSGATEIYTGENIRWMMSPEIADDGAIVFFERPYDGNRRLLYRSPDGTVTLVAQAKDTYKAKWLSEQYDIGPDGEVVYCAQHTMDDGRQANGLFKWTPRLGSVLLDAEGRTHDFPKVGRGGIICLRVSGNEIEQVRTLRDSKFTFIATHRGGFVNRTYGFHWNAVKPGMAISNGKVIFTAHTPRYPFGAWLLRYNGEGDCERLTKPGDMVDGNRILDVTFKDGFNENEGLNFVLDLEDGSGNASQALVTMGVDMAPGPARPQSGAGVFDG